MDKIDLEYYRHSTRLDIKDETRLKATSEEAINWAQEGPSSCKGFSYTDSLMLNSV